MEKAHLQKEQIEKQEQKKLTTKRSGIRKCLTTRVGRRSFIDIGDGNKTEGGKKWHKSFKPPAYVSSEVKYEKCSTIFSKRWKSNDINLETVSLPPIGNIMHPPSVIVWSRRKRLKSWKFWLTKLGTWKLLTWFHKRLSVFDSADLSFKFNVCKQGTE